MVGIGQYEYKSEDGGLIWSRHLREVPGRRTPVVHGNVDINRLPAHPQKSYWDFVTLLPCGFGVAVDHQRLDSTAVANVFVTTDAGQHWDKRDARSRLPLLRRPSCPVEQFAALAVSSPGVIALAWEDPWLFDAPRSHL